MDHLYPLSWITVIFTVIMNLTGIPSCLEIYRSKNTQNVMFLPFVTTGVSNCLWYCYGVFTYDWNLQITNVCCFALQLTFIVIFIAYTDSMLFRLAQCGVAAIILSAFFIYLTTSSQPHQSITIQIGLIATSSTMIMYSSPLMELADVFKTKNARKISLPLTAASLSCSLLWTFYSFATHDLVLLFPNIPGILSSLARFALLWYYGRRENKGQPSLV